MGLVERGEVRALVRRAAAAHPGATLSLMVEGLAHHLETRERREFRPVLLAGEVERFVYCWAGMS